MGRPSRLADCHKNRKHKAKGLCESCYRHKRESLEWRRAWDRKRRKENPKLFMSYNLKYSYGMTIEEFDALHEKQKGLCLICKISLKNNIHVDHDHKTGKIRGLLCRLCNLGLGYFKDDPELLEAAKIYLNDNSMSK